MKKVVKNSICYKTKNARANYGGFTWHIKWVNETNLNDGKKQNSIFSMLVKCSHLLKKVLFNTDVKLFFCSELKQFLFFKTCKTNSVKVFQVSAPQVVTVNQFHIFFIVKMFFQFAHMQDTFWNEVTKNPIHLNR